MLKNKINKLTDHELCKQRQI